MGHVMVRSNVDRIIEEYVSSWFLRPEDVVAARLIAVLHCYLIDCLDEKILNDDPVLVEYLGSANLDEISLRSSSPGRFRACIVGALKEGISFEVDRDARDLPAKILSEICFVPGVAPEKLICLGEDVQRHFKYKRKLREEMSNVV